MAKGRKTGGRTKGTPNRTTREMREWASELFHSAEWRASAAERILSGKAPHLEAHICQVLLPKTDLHAVTTTSLVDLLVADAKEK